LCVSLLQILASHHLQFSCSKLKLQLKRRLESNNTPQLPGLEPEYPCLYYLKITTYPDDCSLTDFFLSLLSCFYMTCDFDFVAYPYSLSEIVLRWLLNIFTVVSRC
jgi:hypothetical protein